MDLITAVREGRAPSILSSFQSCLETNLSVLFFDRERVYKFYKWNIPFFEYSGNPALRKAFYQEDFSWNHLVSPLVYLRLCPVKNKDGEWSLCSVAEADDFYIEMKRADENRNLMEMMLRGETRPEDFRKVAGYLLKSIQKLKREKMVSLESWARRGWQNLMQQRLVSLRGFGESVPDPFDQKEHQNVMGGFQRFFSAHPYFASVEQSRLTVSFDSVSQNILLLEEGVALIDILLPKPEWRVVEPWFNVGYIGADIAVLAGREALDLLYQEYKINNPFPPPEILTFYMQTTAWIRVVYFSILGKPELVKKYKKFVLENRYSL